MKRLTLLFSVFFFSLLNGFSQTGIYLFGQLNGSQGQPVEMLATIYSSSPVEVNFWTEPDGSIETFWVPLPSQEWTHLTVDFVNCQGLAVTAYFGNDSLNPLIDVYLLLDYCNNDYIWGCTNPEALNYNPMATYDDGSCLFDTVENDACEDAIPLQEGIQLIDNTNATNTGDIYGACWGFGNGESEQNSLWYTFTTPAEPAVISIFASADGSGTFTDTQFGLFESCGGEMIYCDGNSAEGLFSAFFFGCGELATNTTYTLMVDGWNGDSGTCFLTYDFSTGCEDISNVPGCTDEAALNYNPLATVDDGTCIYPSDSCSVSFIAIPDSLGENVIWIYPFFDIENIVSVLWDFGDGNTSTELFPQHEYTSEGPFNLCLTVVFIDVQGINCAASFCTTIDGGMIGSGLISSGFSINVVDPAGVLSTGATSNSEDLSIWPNPASDKLNIAMEISSGDAIAVHIFDISGKLLLSENTSMSSGKSQLQIDLNLLETGIYILEIVSKDGRYVEKFVVGR